MLPKPGPALPVAGAGTWVGTGICGSVWKGMGDGRTWQDRSLEMELELLKMLRDGGTCELAELLRLQPVLGSSSF